MRELLPLRDLPFCLPLPLKEEEVVPLDPVLTAGDQGVLLGVVLEDSETVDGTPERAPFVIVLPLPIPFPFGVCANKETIFVCGRL